MARQRQTRAVRSERRKRKDKKQTFFAGARVGKLVLLRRVRASAKLNHNLTKRWKCRCDCGTELVVPEYYMRRKGNPKRDCGCERKTIKTTHNQEYRIWLMMHVRCYDERHMAYHRYGGRGIHICDDWHRDVSGDEGFARFLEHIGPRPSRKFSVDRIDNNGNYEPGNVRWATAEQQAQNRG